MVTFIERPLAAWLGQMMVKSFPQPTSSEAVDITAEAVAGAVLKVMGQHGPAALDAIVSAINDVKDR
jgi:hypothetical protein